MFKNTKTFSSFSVDDSQKAQEFYGETLGMDINLVEGMEDFGMLELHIEDNNTIMIYPKPNHEPATFTVLNFPVKDIDDAVDELINRGVKFERYDEEAFNMDEKNISRSKKGPEPNIAWFKDPAGNILSVLQDN